MVWDDFITYKSIDDQLLVEEFTKEIFIISRNILYSTLSTQQKELLDKRFILSAYQLLDVIDM